MVMLLKMLSSMRPWMAAWNSSADVSNPCYHVVEARDHELGGH
jgi:hypothetical protein